jgi:hypothetical protein
MKMISEVHFFFQEEFEIQNLSRDFTSCSNGGRLCPALRISESTV